jgi:hypothetical protein
MDNNQGNKIVDYFHLKKVEGGHWWIVSNSFPAND